MPSKLILVKHARPLVVPQQLPDLWRLSEEGRAAATRLAGAMRPLNLSRIISSEEIKAIETAEILASELNVPHERAPDLHEHDRSNVPHMRSGEFISHMELFFRRPDERVLGNESAAEALERFEGAVRALCEKHADGNLGVVSHGTVIALLLARLMNRDGFELWRAMQLPSYAEIELNAWRVEALVERL